MFLLKPWSVFKCKVENNPEENAVGSMAFAVCQASSPSNMCMKKHAWEYKTKHRLWNWPGRHGKRSGFSSLVRCFLALGEAFQCLTSHLRHISTIQVLNLWLLLQVQHWNTTAKGTRDTSDAWKDYKIPDRTLAFLLLLLLWIGLFFAWFFYNQTRYKDLLKRFM